MSLAGDWLKLGDGLAAAGDFDAAGQSHVSAAATAHATSEPAIEAEAHFKAYRDACEQARWDNALAALHQAVALDRARFEPFPFRRYEVLGVLGIGGFGAVFHCRDRYAGDTVAVKTLHDGELARDLNEVFAEAHALRRLNHPGIIGIRDQAFADAEAERRPYFVLEYFAGGSLDDHRQKHGSLPPAALLPLARAVADAVHAAHHAGILHRDLKPANVLARANGATWDVRVIDFGLAVRHAAAVHATVAVPSERRTKRERSFAGTLRYAAPEQKGELPGVSIGRYSDVYAFGKTCMELLFGHTEPQDEDWADLPEPWRGRWRKLLGACVRVKVDGQRPRLAGFDAVLAEMDGWEREQAQLPAAPPPITPEPAKVRQAEPPRQKVVREEPRKPGDVLTMRIPAYEPAGPPAGHPRVLTLKWRAAP